MLPFIHKEQTQKQQIQVSFRQYAQFLLIGLSNSILDIIVFNIGLHLYPKMNGWQLMEWNTLAVLSAIVNSYIWNRKWTFRHQAIGGHREGLLFFIQAILNIVFNNLILGSLGTTSWWLGISPAFNSNIDKICAMFISSLFSFFCNEIYCVSRKNKTI